MPMKSEEIAAAWRAWHSRHGGKIGPGPAFQEALDAVDAMRDLKIPGAIERTAGKVNHVSSKLIEHIINQFLEEMRK